MDAWLVHRRAGPRRAQANPPLFPVRARLMKRAFFCANKRARCIRSALKPLRERTAMSKKQKMVVRKPSKKIADARRVRFGGGSAPRVLRTVDSATQDSR